MALDLKELNRLYALRPVIIDLSLGLAGKKGQPLRHMASDALAERLRSLRFPWRKNGAVAPEQHAEPPAFASTFERRQRERRQKSLKIIRGIHLQRFQGKAAAAALATRKHWNF